LKTPYYDYDWNTIQWHSLVITGEPTYATSKQWHCAPQLYQLSSEKKMLHCQLCSTRYTAVRINNCLKITSAMKVAPPPLWKLRMISATNGSHNMPSYHRINTQRWMGHTKEGTSKSMKSALYVQRYGKRQLSGWSDIEQRKNQTCIHSNYRVMQVWRHQSGI